MEAATRKDALARLRRIGGQLSGVQRMIEDGRSCTEILVQIAAMRAALVESSKVLLAGHVAHEIGDAVLAETGAERVQRVRELVSLLGRFVELEVKEEAATTKIAGRR